MPDIDNIPVITHDLLSKLRYRRGNAHTPKYIFTGISPGKYELLDEEKRALVGPSGQLLDIKLLNACGISISDCYFTNLIKEYIPDPPKGKKDKDVRWIKENPSSYATYLKILNAELNLVCSQNTCNILVPLGEIALQAICGKKGIGNWRGSIINSSMLINGKPKKCVPILHPAAILRTWSALSYTKFDVRRIKEEALTPDIKLPERKYVIRPDFDTAIKYLTYYINTPNKVSTDIETLRTRPNRIVSIQFADSPYLGFCLPFQYRNGTSYWTPKQEVVLWRMVYRILTTKQLIGHNFLTFDTFMFHFHGIPYEKILKQVWLDTLEGHQCAYPDLPKSLAFCVSYLTREPFYKDEGKEWSTKMGEDEFWTYGCKDVCLDCEIAPLIEQDLRDDGLWEQYKEKYYEMSFNRMQISTTGLKIDLNKREQLSVEYTKDIVKNQCKITTLCGENVNVGSHKQMCHLLYDTMKLPPQYTREGAITTNEDALLNLSTLSTSGIFPLVINQRSLRVLKSNNIDCKLDSDNFVRSSFGFTETGRLTSSGTPLQTGQNLQNWQKKMRAMIIPFDPATYNYDPKIHVLGKGDLSQAEARIVAWKGKLYKSIELFLDPNRDIHTETAMIIFEMLREQIRKEFERYSAKRIRHALNYDMHAKRFAATFNKDAADNGVPLITVPTAQGYIDKFHIMEPNLQAVYHNDIKLILHGKIRPYGPKYFGKVLFNIFGRRMFFTDRLGDELYRAAYSWYAQSTVGDLINIIWKKCKTAGLRIIHQNHDEILWISNRGEEEKDAEIVWNAAKIPMDICPDKNVPPLIIPIDVGFGDNWYNMTDIKPMKKAA